MQRGWLWFPWVSLSARVFSSYRTDASRYYQKMFREEICSPAVENTRDYSSLPGKGTDSCKVLMQLSWTTESLSKDKSPACCLWKSFIKWCGGFLLVCFGFWLIGFFFFFFTFVALKDVLRHRRWGDRAFLATVCFLTSNQNTLPTLICRCWACFLWAEKIWSISGLHLDSVGFVLLVLHPRSLKVPHFSLSCWLDISFGFLLSAEMQLQSTSFSEGNHIRMVQKVPC